MRDGTSQIADLLARHIRRGDRIFVGQGSAQPPSLTRALIEASARIGPCEVFIGPLFDAAFATSRDVPLNFTSYAAMGAGMRLAKEGRLRIVPLEYADLERDVASGEIAVDVVFLLAGRRGDAWCAAFANDYVLAAARRARCVFLEENAEVPWCEGARIDPDVKITARVASDHPLVTLPARAIGNVEIEIARNIAALVPDEATLQTGIGAIPEATLSQLTCHRNLGLHSGVIGEGHVDLAESGALTNAQKSVDQGTGVTNTAFGDRRLRDLIGRDRRLRFAPASYTHDLGVLARQRRMIAINSVLEIDLLGRANAEWIEGRRAGGIGGLRAFSRGAMAAPEGLSILALRASDRSGARSRVRARLDHVTLGRSEVDAVVTEYGVARLRGLSCEARARSLIELAAPEHREGLMRAWRDGERSNGW